jgi:RNA polymerase sigma-70 factor, ECF subfamily
VPLSKASESVSDQFRFQQLVEPHLGRLLGFASRRLRNSADAEDVVQEACTRAWLAFGDLRDERQILGWLYRILRSALGDFVEKRERRERLAPTLGLEFAGDHLLASQDPAPLERLIASMSIEAIYELMRTLPEEFALAMELHDLEGLRYREIAELTGVPIGTVMSRLSRGRRALAALIATDIGLRDLVTPEQDRVPLSRRVLKRQA